MRTFNFSSRRLWALCLKETRQILRDPSSILIAFIMPLVLLFTMGYAINADLDHVPIGLRLEDSSAAARDFAQTLSASQAFDVRLGESRAQLMQRMARGELRGVVIIQNDFSRRLQSTPNGSAVQVLVDGAEPNTAGFIGAYVQAVWQRWQREYVPAQQRAVRGAASTATVDVKTRAWFNPSAISRNFLVPGEISVIMTIIGALLTSLVVAREWERGTMEGLLSTPMTRAEFLLSKIIPYYVLGLIAMVICWTVAVGIMGVPFRGSLGVLLVMLTLFLGAALGLGLFLSTAFRSQFNAAQAALSAAFLPSLMLSGMVYEISSMPEVVQWITRFISARYFTNSLQTLFLVPDVPEHMWVNIICLLLLSVFWIGLTAMMTRRSLD